MHCSYMLIRIIPICIIGTPIETVDLQAHWEGVYRTKRPTEVSWYRRHLEMSLELIEEAAPGLAAAIVDVGAGESTLIDDLLVRGYHNLHAMDLSSTALDIAKARLGQHGGAVHWHSGDVRTFPFKRHQYDVWHDRAVFHFLTGARDRHAYVRQVLHAVKPGGHVIVATFGPEGPGKCSGLKVARYDAETLHEQFGTAFQLVRHMTEIHRTPSSATQQFTYCFCKIEHAEDGF